MKLTLRFKVASEPSEFEQIHELNYKTFVEEIPQHKRNEPHILIDKFHSENSYLICLHDDQLVGMVAVRGKRPFSLDQKLPDLDSLLPPGRSVCEVRLLAVVRRYRNSIVLRGLLKLLLEYFKRHGYDLAIISGIVRQQKLYHHLGFVPFGPLVGEPGAIFQPMWLAIEMFENKVRVLRKDQRVPSDTTVL